MNRESRYSGYIGLIIGVALALLLLALGGCATKYEIKVCNQGSSTCSYVNVSSFREFSQPNVHYSRDGKNVTFSFGAEDAITGTSPVEQAVADVIRSSPQLILPRGAGVEQ